MVELGYEVVGVTYSYTTMVKQLEKGSLLRRAGYYDARRVAENLYTPLCSRLREPVPEAVMKILHSYLRGDTHTLHKVIKRKFRDLLAVARDLMAKLLPDTTSAKNRD